MAFFRNIYNIITPCKNTINRLWSFYVRYK